MEACPICSKENVGKDINGMLDGVIYYFCCDECKTNFMSEPRKYVNCCESSKTTECGNGKNRKLQQSLKESKR